MKKIIYGIGVMAFIYICAINVNVSLQSEKYEGSMDLFDIPDYLVPTKIPFLTLPILFKIY